MADYTYNKVCDAARLEEEIIADTAITIQIDSVSVEDPDTTCSFQATLPSADETALDALVTAHVNTSLEDTEIITTQTANPTTDEDNIPLVYASSMPIDHYVCFQGACDDPEEEDKQVGMGEGCRVLFELADTDDSKSMDFTFNESVYLKDAFMIVEGAPFGASVDGEVVHPTLGHMLWFVKNVPIMGSLGWFPMDTENRAAMPFGLIMRITVHNATRNGGTNAAFKLAGRFELFRPKPPGT